MQLRHGHLRIFTATRIQDIPAGVRVHLCVDGTVPGAARCYDHHVTGEPINLDAMPAEIDATAFDGLGTTQADADAMASMVAVLLGGKGCVPPRALGVLESASHWCDHLVPHPAHPHDVNEDGRGLMRALAVALGDARTPQTSGPLDRFCREVAGAIVEGRALPHAPDDEGTLARARALAASGRITQHGDVALVDQRGLERVGPEAVCRVHGCAVTVTYDDHVAGGYRYTVGVNPFVASPVTDLRPALRAVAAEEYRRGPPVKGAEPVAGNENWGGRAAVFGSPFNQGSRLTPREVVELVAGALGRTGRT